jgi:iron complex outermembrane receptor protein
MPPNPVAPRPPRSILLRVCWLSLALLFPFYSGATALAEEAGRRHFDIPAGPAVTTLKRAAQQAGLEIVYSASVVIGVQTQSVQGDFTPREALDYMVANTPLKIFPDPKTGAISVRRASDPAPPAPNPSAPPKEPPRMKRKNLFTTIGTWLGLVLSSGTPVHSADGSPATGTVTGRVYNPARGEYVRSAEVRIAGTNQVAYTENDGSFQFSPVPAGPVSLTVTYTGYRNAQDSLTVIAGQTAVREILLQSATTETKEGSVVRLDAYTVSTEREGSSKAIMDQRRNMNISTSVSSDIFGDVTDGNVGEFLKYLPGVDLDYVQSEARGPRLGGMDSQYVGVSFDGIRTASADAQRTGDASRATSFEAFSITSIDSIEISRTTSADSDADSPAGTINMKTKRAFDRKGRHVGFNAGLNFNSEEFTLKKTDGPRDKTDYKWKPNYQFDYSDVFLNQRLGILLSASRANSYTEQYDMVINYSRRTTTTDPDTRPLVVRGLTLGDAPKFIFKDALMLTADFKATPRLVLSLNAIYTYTEGEIWNRQYTFSGASDNTNANTGRRTILGDGLLEVRTSRSALNTVPALSNPGGGSTKLTYTRTFSPKIRVQTRGLGHGWRRRVFPLAQQL